MECNLIHTGPQFLWATLANIDCHARGIGAYGYGALSNPGSMVATALTLLLTIFIALLGLRLLLGDRVSGGDVITDFLRIGIVLALASSWPAWRIVGYDVALDAPMQIADLIGVASGLPGSRGDIRPRLQDADNAMVAMTVYGTGRLTGGVAAGTDLGDSPSGIALPDQFAFGMGRAIFLASTIGSYALIRLGAGILLAIAPLMAGLLLLAGTRSLFVGWIKGIAFVALANLFLIIAQETQLAMFYPWMRDVLAQRASGVFTVSAPTELLVLSTAYGSFTIGLIYLAARIAFLPAFSVRSSIASEHRQGRHYDSFPSVSAATMQSSSNQVERSHAQTIAGSVRQSMLREERQSQAGGTLASYPRSQTTAQAITGLDQAASSPPHGSGSDMRRNRRRTSAASRHRDAG